jgi:hypothetical protein
MANNINFTEKYKDFLQPIQVVGRQIYSYWYQKQFDGTFILKLTCYKKRYHWGSVWNFECRSIVARTQTNTLATVIASHFNDTTLSPEGVVIGVLADTIWNGLGLIVFGVTENTHKAWSMNSLILTVISSYLCCQGRNESSKKLHVGRQYNQWFIEDMSGKRPVVWLV